jgi:hypothetical protein
MIIGSEFLALEGSTLIGQNHYRIARVYRGYGGTPISSVTSGAMWHHHGAGVFEHPINVGDIGTILYYKVVPYNFAGQAVSISSITAKTYQIKGDYWLPSAQPRISLFVQSATAWPSSSEFCGYNLSVTSGGCDVVLTWNPGANNEGFGYGGAGNGGYGHFALDVLTPSYRVDVMSTNGSKVSSFFTNTGYFDYNRAQNSADFSGFRGGLTFQVTPYNTRGDGYAPNARSLSLF